MPSHAAVAPRTRRLARRLRHTSTPWEQRLWGHLRSRRFADFKFRRQVPIGPYVADFACFSAGLIVELDGLQHAESQRDTIRDAELRRRGFRILRIWNGDLTRNAAAVLDTIFAHLQEETP